MERRNAYDLARDCRAFVDAKHRDFAFAVARIAYVESATGQRIDYVLESDDDSHDILADLVAHHTKLNITTESGEDGSWSSLELDGRTMFTLDWTECEEVIDGPISVSLDRSDILIKARVVAIEEVDGHKLVTVEVEGRLECDPLPRRMRNRFEMEA